MNEVRRRARLVEEYEGDMMQTEDIQPRMLCKRAAFTENIQRLNTCRMLAAANLRMSPDSLGAEQVLRSMEAKQLHAELALQRISDALSVTRARGIVMSRRLGRAREALNKCLKNHLKAATGVGSRVVNRQ